MAFDADDEPLKDTAVLDLPKEPVETGEASGHGGEFLPLSPWWCSSCLFTQFPPHAGQNAPSNHSLLPPPHGEPENNAYVQGFRLAPGQQNSGSLYKPAFSREEYAAREATLRATMRRQGLTLVVVSSPANLNYLTGFDGWGHYQPQFLLVSATRTALVVRGMDAAAGHSTTYLASQDILA